VEAAFSEVRLRGPDRTARIPGDLITLNTKNSSFE
jgi:hypothetical protein